jgi:putative ABC transport system ATP-binding protein
MNESSPSIIVSCKNLHKTFGEGTTKVEALRGVNLTIEKGELRMLMGPSGSGKTTLISIIAGILSQDEGECTVIARDINHLPNGEKTHFRGQNVGFVFQSFNLIPTLNAEENVSIPLILNKVPKEKALEMSKALLSQVGMADKIGVYPNQLSGGQQQRVAIARSLIHEPKLIVCDEPTSYLDLDTGTKVMDLLRDLIHKKGTTLIVVTHDPRITHFADKIDHLEDGKIVNHTQNTQNPQNA